MIKTFCLKFSVHILYDRRIHFKKNRTIKRANGEIKGIRLDCFLFAILFLWNLKKVLFLQKNSHWMGEINPSFKWSLKLLFITSESKENCQRNAIEK